MTAPTAFEPETITVAHTRVACDGGKGALGHPLVYLDMGAEGRVECPYCDRLFILGGDDHYADPSPRHDGGH